MSAHCCGCEISSLRNRRVFVVVLTLMTGIASVMAFAAHERNWLAMVGWGSWGLLGSVSLLFTNAWKSACAEHGLLPDEEKRT